MESGRLDGGIALVPPIFFIRINWLVKEGATEFIPDVADRGTATLARERPGIECLQFPASNLSCLGTTSHSVQLPEFSVPVAQRFEM